VQAAARAQCAAHLGIVHIGESGAAEPVRHIGGRLNTPQISMGDFGSTYNMQGPTALPRISVRGYFNLYTAIADPLADSDYYQLKDVFALNKGRHSLKFGFEEALEKTYQMTELDNYGRFDFRDGNTGNGFGDFLVGLPRQITRTPPCTRPIAAGTQACSFRTSSASTLG
jgi:hypothetical protein